MKNPNFLEKLSDTELYRKCKYYGEAARIWRQKFIGLLPEVNRRRLYEKKGFNSIFEFAAKLCGLSEAQVRLALNLERVAFIATAENEKELAKKVKVLPLSALNTFVKDMRQSENQNGLPKPLFEDKFTDVRELEFEIAEAKEEIAKTTQQTVSHYISTKTKKILNTNIPKTRRNNPPHSKVWFKPKPRPEISRAAVQRASYYCA